jgi:hypothetical protein
MKIIVKRNRQQSKVIFDLKDVHFPYAIREAIISALLIDGFTQETIDEVFNICQDAKCESK